jgi:protein TonB
MAYATTERNRAATLAAVGALHLGVIYALVTGLAGPMWESIKEKPLVGVNIALPKPPEPIETEPNTDQKTRMTNEQKNTGQAVDIFPTSPTEDDLNLGLPPIGDDFVGGVGGGIGDPVLPLKPTVETFTPKLARPIGKPGQWVTANDYPSNDLRAEHEGTTRFQLSIGADGKVRGCEVTVSSGFASLDKAACDNLRKRGKFAPASGTNGTAVPGTYSSAVQWKIPKD